MALFGFLQSISILGRPATRWYPGRTRPLRKRKCAPVTSRIARTSRALCITTRRLSCRSCTTASWSSVTTSGGLTMATFDVSVCRKSYAYRTIRVEVPDSEDEEDMIEAALNLAQDIALNYEFSEKEATHAATYSALTAARVEGLT